MISGPCAALGLLKQFLPVGYFGFDERKKSLEKAVGEAFASCCGVNLAVFKAGGGFLDLCAAREVWPRGDVGAKLEPVWPRGDVGAEPEPVWPLGEMGQRRAARSVGPCGGVQIGTAWVHVRRPWGWGRVGCGRRQSPWGIAERFRSEQRGFMSGGGGAGGGLGAAGGRVCGALRRGSDRNSVGSCQEAVGLGAGWVRRGGRVGRAGRKPAHSLS